MKAKYLIATLFFFILTACHPALPDHFFTVSILPRTQTSSPLQLDLLVESNYSSTASTTEAYELELFSYSGEWEPIEPALEFNHEPLTIEPYESHTFLIDLEAYLGTLDIPDGTYRVSKVFFVNNNPVEVSTTFDVQYH